MDRIEVKINFQHMWFPQGKFHSFWSYYNKVNLETEKQSEAQTIRRFLQRQSTPAIVQNEGNKKNILKLKQLNETLNRLIRSSVRKCCCFYRDEIIFGRLDQAKMILKETFEGTHIFVDGPDGNKIDCMFFPCTHKEKIVIDEDQDLEGNVALPSGTSNKNSVNSSTRARSQPHHLIEDLFDGKEPQYLSKPTIIMCNPNALIYQQMITSPNAYWLNFFLKREINVLCWNYRGYGESELGFWENLDPYKSKRDAERVLAFAVNKLHLRGKIGVYGRSIGGLAACHLA